MVDTITQTEQSGKALLDKEGNVGIFAKGCDARSIVVCIAEGQIEREKVVIIGLPCQGVLDRKKVEAELDGKEVLEATINEERIAVNTGQHPPVRFKTLLKSRILAGLFR